MSHSDFPNTPWATAIAASPRHSEPGTYDVTIPKDWSIANCKFSLIQHLVLAVKHLNSTQSLVPLGGYLNSLLTNAVRTHFTLHYNSLNQPNPITSHCAFISRASFGPGQIRITISKPGRQYSNVLARLYQSPKGAEVLVAEAMITQGNLARERASGGISLPIANPIPATEIFKRSEGIEMIEPPHMFRLVAAATKIRRCLPPGTSSYDGNWSHPIYGPSVREEWMSWHERSGETGGFDSQAIALLIDCFRQPAFDFEGIEVSRNWMATMSITMDIKKSPPVGSEGWEWLFLRAVVGKCNFGRYSMDITLLDEEGDVVAVGRRAELVLGEERRAEKNGEKSRI